MYVKDALISVRARMYYSPSTLHLFCLMKPRYALTKPWVWLSRGLVPALDHDSVFVNDSLVTCEYLAEIFSQNSTLMPASIVERAKVMTIHAYCGFMHIFCWYKCCTYMPISSSMRAVWCTLAPRHARAFVKFVLCRVSDSTKHENSRQSIGNLQPKPKTASSYPWVACTAPHVLGSCMTTRFFPSAKRLLMRRA